MGVPSWATGEWDVLKLGGDVIPGIPDVEVRIRSNLDVKKPSGKRGAKSRDRGDEPCEVTIRIRVPERDRDAFKAVAHHFKPRSADDPREPLEIDHPNTDFWTVRAIQVKDVESPMPSSKDDWIITANCIEYVPAPVQKAVRKPSAKPKDDRDAWLPFVDDTVATGSPALNGAAESMLFPSELAPVLSSGG